MKFQLFWLSIISLLAVACSRNNIHEKKQWADIYKKYGITEAGFEVKDQAKERIFYYNLSHDSTRYSPASTFKVFNSLVALETGVAPDENLMIKWDGIKRREEWNRDMTMAEAFKVSCLPYYRELARRIGKTEMKKYIDSCSYGNMKADSIDMFWIDNTLKISPDEQVLLMKKLYYDELPFQKRNQRIVRQMMLQEDSANYKLYFKTGTNIISGKLEGWLVGFLEVPVTMKNRETYKEETNVNPYFFANHIVTSDTTKNWREERIAITKDIFRELGLIK